MDPMQGCPVATPLLPVCFTTMYVLEHPITFVKTMTVLSLELKRVVPCHQVDCGIMKMKKQVSTL